MYSREELSIIIVGFDTLFPAHNILLALALEMKVLPRHDQGSTPEGIRAHSHGRILSLWFNALYTLYDTIFVLFFFLFFFF